MKRIAFSAFLLACNLVIWFLDIRQLDFLLAPLLMFAGFLWGWVIGGWRLARRAADLQARVDGLEKRMFEQDLEWKQKEQDLRQRIRAAHDSAVFSVSFSNPDAEEEFNFSSKVLPGQKLRTVFKGVAAGQGDFSILSLMNNFDLTRSQADDLRAELLDIGLLKWNVEGAPRQGVSPTFECEALLDSLKPASAKGNGDLHI